MDGDRATVHAPDTADPATEVEPRAHPAHQACRKGYRSGLPPRLASLPRARSRADARDYFGAYVPEFRQGVAQAVVLSIRTRHEAKRARRAVRAPELEGRLKRRKRIKSIEVLITSPRFLTKPKDS